MQDPHQKHREARTSIQGDIEATTQSKCDAFRKGVTPMAPPSHVPNGLGFLPWMSTLGETRRPQQGKRRPMASPSPKNPQAQMPGQEANPLTIQHLQRRVPLHHGSPIRRASTHQLHAAAAKLRRPPPHPTRQHAETGQTPPVMTAVGRRHAGAVPDDLQPGLRRPGPPPPPPSPAPPRTCNSPWARWAGPNSRVTVAASVASRI